MTDEQIDAMQAGDETDRRVAAACGIAIFDPDHSGSVLLDDGDIFAPSDDWNSAMFAAERFGLFDTEKHQHTLTFSDFGDGADRWFCANYDEDSQQPTGAPTGPLAICRAILRLANRISS